MPPETVIVVAARNEADRLGATVDGLRRAFGDAPIVVVDDASTDGTATAAERAAAVVVRTPTRMGKGGAATLGAAQALRLGGPGTVYVLCDGDLAASAARLGALARAVRGGMTDLAVAAFARRVGGGFGLAVGFAGWALRRRTGLELGAPISGQRALSEQALVAALPFAPGFGMELGMTIDVAGAGLRITEIELDLEHRATGRSPAGFIHRGRQLRDLIRVYAAPRRPGRAVASSG